MAETTEPSSSCRLPCSYCSETFACRIRRILHIKIHHGDGPFPETDSNLNIQKSRNSVCSNDVNESAAVISSMCCSGNEPIRSTCTIATDERVSRKEDINNAVKADDAAMTKPQATLSPVTVPSPVKASVASAGQVIPCQKDPEEVLALNKTTDLESADEGNKISHLACSQRFSSLLASSSRSKVVELGHESECNIVERNIFNPVRVEKAKSIIIDQQTDHSYCVTPAAQLEQRSVKSNDLRSPRRKHRREQESEMPKLESEIRFSSIDDGTYNSSDDEARKKSNAVQFDEPDYDSEVGRSIQSSRKKKITKTPVSASISLDDKGTVHAKEYPISATEDESYCLTKPSIPTDLTPERKNAREGVGPQKLINLHSHNKKLKTRRRNGKVESRCNYCSKYFDISYLAIHQRCHTGERPFKCSLCPKAFARRDTLQGHQLIHYHVSKVGGKYNCPHSCGHTAESKRPLRTHMKMHHRMSDHDIRRVIRKSKSSATGVSFGVESSQSVSPKNNASASQYKTSPEMDETGSSNRQVTTTTAVEDAYTLENHAHQKLKSSSDECPYCHKTFRRDYIVYHIRIHTGEKPFRCRFCSSKFPRPDYLRDHLRKKHGRTMTDKDIKLNGSQSSSTTENTKNRQRDVFARSSHGPSTSVSKNSYHELVLSAKPTKSVSLSHAPRRVTMRAKNPTTLGSRARSGRKRKRPSLQCVYCFKIQPSFRRLQEHMSIHTDQKLYECSMCDKSFRYGFDFSKHKKTAHGNSAGCVPRNPIRAQTHMTKPYEAQGHRESEGEANGNSTTATASVKLSSSESSSTRRIEVQTAKDLKKRQACILCDELPEHLKIHLMATHNVSEEKAEKLMISA